MNNQINEESEMNTTAKESNLVSHARAELPLLGDTDDAVTEAAFTVVRKILNMEVE